MIAKCANPSCSAVLRYLYQGRVFVVPSSEDGGTCSHRANFCGFIRHAQYVWLCSHCAKTMRVTVDSNKEIHVVREAWTTNLVSALVPLLWVAYTVAIREAV